MKTLALVLLALARFGQLAAAQTPTHPDLTYATLGTQELKLDLYLPTTGSPPYPVWISIHGGGWSIGSKSPLPGASSEALTAGFAVASIDYRLTSQAAEFAPYPVTFPAQIHDVKGAVRWLRAHASAYQLDVNRFCVFGLSAGGHLSALLATSGGVSALEGDVGGNASFSSRVQVAVDFYGPTAVLQMTADETSPPGSAIDHDAPSSPESQLVGWTGPGQGIGDIRAHASDPTPPYPALVTLVNQLNPITWVDPSDPPMFIAHGTNDTTVQTNQSTRLSAALFAAGVPHDHRAVPDAAHSLTTPVFTAAIAFARARLDGTALPDAGLPFCFGDGSAGPCPCGNTSFAGANMGCRNSLMVGSNLSAIGVPSVSADSLLLRGDSMPNGPVVFLQGTHRNFAGLGTTFGDGLKCLSGSVRRLGSKVSALGWTSFPGSGDSPVSVTGLATPGTTLYYQLWFRDTSTYCTSAPWNLSNALMVNWGP